jgi:hypothetical protein
VIGGVSLPLVPGAAIGVLLELLDDGKLGSAVPSAEGWLVAAVGGGVAFGVVDIPGVEAVGAAVVGLCAVGLVTVPPVLVAGGDPEASVAPAVDPEDAPGLVFGPYVLVAPSTVVGACVAVPVELDAELVSALDATWSTEPWRTRSVPTDEPPDAAVAPAVEVPAADVPEAGAAGAGAPAALKIALVTRPARSVVDCAAVLFCFGISVGTASGAGAIASVLLEASLIAALRTVSATGGWDRT